MVTTDNDPVSVFRQLDNYSWDSDDEFQGGLRAILGSVQNPDQVAHLTLRAKCYYYARKAGQPIDFNAYKRWVESGMTENEETGQIANDAAIATGSGAESEAGEGGGGGGGMADAPKPASFAEICDLIAEGKPIPGIKDIPDTVLEGQASKQEVSGRRKPWEKDGSAMEKPSWMT